MKAHVLPILLTLAVLLTGCATSLTNMSPARTYEVGEGQATTGYQFDVHTQAFTGVYSAGDAVVRQIGDSSDGEPIEVETLRTALDAIILWQLFPLGGGLESMGRVGLRDSNGVGFGGIDAGFRYNGNVLKGDLRLQLWESFDESMAISAQFGYGHHASIFRAALRWVALAEWRRHDFDFQVNFGYEIDHWVKMYVAPRYILSRISTEIAISDRVRDRMPERYRDWDPGQYVPSTNLHYAGLNAGGMFGYRYAFINVDFSVFRVIFNPTVLESERDYSGWVYSPTLGITLMWR